MEHPVNEGNRKNTILEQVHENMPVCDRAGSKIGKVRRVYLGAVADTTNQGAVSPATATAPEWHSRTAVDQVADLFTDESMPEGLRERLLRQGFIQIDTSGLFASDRFALPDQIDSVADDCVQLGVTRDGLIAG